MSNLFITKIFAISIIPDLIIWISSPIFGVRVTMVVSDNFETSISL